MAAGGRPGIGDPRDRDRPVQTAGTYYVQVSVGRSTASLGTVVPLRLTIDTGFGVAAEAEW
ncbi:hypothetical protein [Streptomyces sp. NPDC102437]|uniref:hypothetical protein n=1 Tax=Streptomyces sp. NPDC102437 TaxID=3366175 RepID=UPI003819EBB9